MLNEEMERRIAQAVKEYVPDSHWAKDYEDALLWLEDAGMICRINNISKPGMPLNAYSNPNAFKVYACDCGLLRRLALLPPSAILDNTSNYTEFKGAMAENAVLQSLMTVIVVGAWRFTTTNTTPNTASVFQCLTCKEMRDC